MRGESKGQPEFLTVCNLESLIPKRHPIRAIKRRVDEVLRRLSRQLEASYCQTTGRPSIPPEQLLKSKILMALFSVRSERLFAEQLAYNLMWQWFLDRDLEEGTFNHSTFSKNYDRLFAEPIAAAFFAEVYQLSLEEDWASNEHFSADGTLIEAWASVKSFRPKVEAHDVDDSDSDDGNSGNQGDGNGFKPSNPDVDFKGQKRSNKTHRSRTDPESVLYRKGKYKEAKMCFGLHGIMENRNGLLSDIAVHNPVTTQEPTVALEQIERIETREHGGVETLGADKGYHTKTFVGGCRKRCIKPHVAEVKNRTTPGLDGRTTGSRGYKTSQRIRKRIEEIFGWMKTVGVFRKTRYRGRGKVQSEAYFTGATFNLIRMANLESAEG